MSGVADEGASLKLSYFLGQTIFYGEPHIVARYYCFLLPVSEAHYRYSGRRVDLLIAYGYMKIVFPFILNPLYRPLQPFHHENNNKKFSIIIPQRILSGLEKLCQTFL
jgi:hypothetical protein